MVKRKLSKSAHGTEKEPRVENREPASKSRPVRRRFIISNKARAQTPGQKEAPAKAPAKPATKPAPKATATPGAAPVPPTTPISSSPPSAMDLAEVIKTLLHLAHENGHVTYDDINDVLPDGMSPDDLDELYTKLRNLDIEIVDAAEVERAKAAE